MKIEINDIVDIEDYNAAEDYDSDYEYTAEKAREESEAAKSRFWDVELPRSFRSFFRDRYCRRRY